MYFYNIHSQFYEVEREQLKTSSIGITHSLTLTYY